MNAQFTCWCDAPMETEGEFGASGSDLYVECTECEYSYVVTLSRIGGPTGGTVHSG